MADDFLELRTDIKILLVASAKHGEQLEELKRDFAEHTRPCGMLKTHLDEHEAIKAEGKGAIKWILTSILAPMCAAISGYLAAKFGIPGIK
jgi:hypothetical protein